MSRIICGDEDRHIELRMRTFIELCKNKDKYLNDCYLKELTGLDDYVENLLGSSFHLSSKTKRKQNTERQREGFEAGIVDTSKPGTYSTMWHIFALSNILGFPIQTVYPEVKGSLVNRNYVNVHITPSQMQHSKVAYIMWTHTSNVDFHGWTPNHFALLIPVPPLAVGAAQAKPSAPPLRWLNTVLQAVSGNFRDGVCFKLDRPTWRRKSNGTQKTISQNLLIRIL